MRIEIGEKFVHDWFGESNAILVNGELVGIIIYEVNKNIEINRIAIEPEYRRQGIGAKVIEHLMNLHPYKNVVGMAEPDRVAVGFWKKLGAELDFENADWYIPFILNY